jgi:pimeloyl-ACP methyl ester carboxylesterase
MGGRIQHSTAIGSGLQSTTVKLADGRRIHCRCTLGVGEPLVLLHGLLDSSEGWSEFAAAQRRPCIAVDLPGFGFSDLPTRPRIGAYADDIHEALELLDVPTPVGVIGHSLGGAVAAALAERMAEKVSALLMLAPAGFGRIPLAEVVSIPGARQLTRLWMPLALGHRLPLTLAYRGFVNAEHNDGGEMLDRIVKSEADLAAAAGAATQAIAAAGHSKHGFHRRRVRYDGPVTAMWGTRDRIVSPKHSRGVMTAFPQARIVEWQGIGHHPQCERPGELLALAARACALRSARTEQIPTPRSRRRTAPAFAPALAA